MSLTIHNLFCSYRKVQNKRQNLVLLEKCINLSSEYRHHQIHTTTDHRIKKKKTVCEQQYAGYCERKYVSVKQLKGNVVQQDFVIATERSAVHDIY